MFYTYHQNNSGGSFIGPALYVSIEANNRDEANERALDVGIYFDGCDDGSDCSCCGDRWNRYADEGKVPTIYGQKLRGKPSSYDVQYLSDEVRYSLIYYKDGRKKVK